MNDLLPWQVGLSLMDRKVPFTAYADRKVVAELIASAMRNGGCGTDDATTPFEHIIKPGMSVLIKPNWVLHYNKSGKGMDCMITHPVFIEEVIKQVAKASPRRIILADAPIQSTIFSEIAPPEWQKRLKKLAAPCELNIIDLRRSIWQGQGCVTSNNRKESDYVLFNLGSKSLLEPISTPIGRFRNTSYDPKSLSKTHRPNVHQYLLAREAFESDVIINLPKLKSHRKAGLTAALKNLVGINGDKDFLPHHRFGGPEEGGDCYEKGTFWSRLAERTLDHANRNLNKRTYYPWSKVTGLFIKVNNIFEGETELEGGWYGNDTTWRMVLDLNRIIIYGKNDGTIAQSPQRKVFSLTDAIVAGEAFGPLAPEPVNLGAVTFASSSAYADLLHSALMRFNWEKIPSISHSFDQFEFPIANSKPSAISIVMADRKFNLSEAALMFGMKFKPARGWQNHIEYY